MNAGVEILLKRMDSHPEEFQGLGLNITSAPEYRWERYVLVALDSKFLTDEERYALLFKLSSIQGVAFTQAVMRELMSDNAEKYAETYMPNCTKAVIS